DIGVTMHLPAPARTTHATLAPADDGELLVIARVALRGSRAHEAPRPRLPPAPAASTASPAPAPRAPSPTPIELEPVMTTPTAGRPGPLPTESYLALRAQTASHRRAAYALFL